MSALIVKTATPAISANQAIWFVGDVHGEFGHVLQAVEDAQIKPMHIVFLGDQACTQPITQTLAPLDAANIEWSFIIGNHDTDTEEEYDYLFGGEGQGHCIDGRIITLGNGIRLAGLGGIFRKKIWDGRLQGAEPPRFQTEKDYLRTLKSVERWRGGMPLKQRSSILPEIYQNLAKQHCEVLVTHEGPGWHPYGFSRIDELATAMGARWHLHGHLHQNVRYRPTDDYQGYGLAGGTILAMTGNTFRVIHPGFDKPDWRVM